MSYCFDQAQIAQIQQRVTCLLELADAPDAPTEAIAGLQTVFGALGGDPADPVLGRGFEDLFAELVIMRGDEALTAAYNTRYAVGQGQGLPFEGEDFEIDGLNLSGIAGAEMVYLYSAVQAYDLALGRFFGQVPTLWANAIEPIRERRYVTEATVTGWMQRVIRASTQRARAQSEIARRYQVFGRPDLARRVIQRAYVRAHQEGLVLSSLMGAIADRVVEQYKPQVRRELAQAQRRYRVALLEMGDVHAQVVSGTDYFGFPQGYVPFPALDEDAVNGFEEMLGRAMDRLELAAADEERAIAERREFDSDEAAFRAELLTQRNTYETALGTLCGTFIGTDGRTWPAIPAYVHLMPDAERVVGDPCGRVGNGDIYLKAADLQTAELLLTRVRQEASNALAEMRDVFNEVKDRCALIDEDAAEFLERQQVIDGIEGGIDGMELSISIIDKLYDFITEGTARAIEANNEDTPAGIFMDSLSNGAWVVAAGAHFASTTALESTILTSRGVIREKARKYEEWQIKRECAYLEHERGYQIRALERDFLLTRLDVLQTAWDVDVVISQLRSLLNERNRIESEWADAQQLTAEAAAAQSDPTKRIYKNDAIRNAEQSFEVALRAAWQATLTYEYYTGSTYPQRDALFLARLVDRGDIPLRRYLEDLRERFFAFEQVYGNPDTRVARISVCNDIFDISYLDANGQARDDLDRAEECRRRLKDPAMLDASGALRIPFSTDFDALSPRTVNHKILFAEIGLAGDLGGDGVARAYLESSGTGVVTGTDGQRRFYTFPPRTAVMNPVFRDDEGLTFGQDSDGAIT
ncbi:MAG: hypothetical protein KC613_05275, partial [Myxococcales bacterium]|nr:hypothetical protein [Myxococcales bacterium]